MGRQDAQREYKQKLRELHELQKREKAAGRREESAEYLRLSRELDRLEKHVPWWRR